VSHSINCFFMTCLLFLNSPTWAASGLELLGQLNLPTGLMYENTEVGGLSGISYAPDEDVYYVISDDRSFKQPARFYRLAIDLSGENFTNLTVKITAVPGNLHMNGLVELLALDNLGNYLALERAFAEGSGFNIRLYRISAGNRADEEQLTTLSKKLVLNFNSLGIPLDNLEGMSLGPYLPDGRRSLVVISDNNFSREQFTQILIFALDPSIFHPIVRR